MTIRDLFLEKQEYIVEFDLNECLSLFIEGLDDLGCSITTDTFDINNIENLCVEIIDIDGEMLDTGFETDYTLDSELKDLIKLINETMGY